ncbi:universal stress protein [Dyadobacter sp. CY312]|uniref:universal stress protein n=1 Tax=Dyadobacter sp. CY312 TaxID=2907303 RepID=UPI001F1D5A3C|nr:universal stress protein [Dyadobacter sp. CY312]MCE7040488.1 universal stress protein [Dyadobacter sp. CY312]
MKTILVPIDFSENAAQAIAAAKVIASKTDAELVFLHAYQPYITDISLPVTVNTMPVYKELEESYKAQLEEHVVLARQEGFKTEGIWETGGIHDAIIKNAEDLLADLIVVGRTGKGSFMDKLIGSAATSIALEAPCPVLVIPPQVINIDFRRIVYATQLEYEEMNNLREVATLARLLGARLTFIKISSLEQPNIQSDQQYIEQMTSGLGIPASDIVIHKGGGVEEGIKKHCKEVNADLLIVSTRERGFLEQLIINPSITKKLVVETNIPLLVYHI